ncbi:hypothetical protein [Nonlabens antarcticus]|uniref:hypothetical protein n=1 Tax=Nonlabens antarcticus TaxID=392714 RepID=UPI0018910281|nr:hypothetical protein [Nonlabens antarcticus]
MEKDEVSNWINKIKAKKPPAVTQKVVPVIQEKPKDEVQLSCYVDKGLMKSLKMQALKEDETIKNIINKSITLYIKSND